MSDNEESKLVNCSQVRYIKLGRAGRWERECLSNGIIRLGFGTGAERAFELCRNGQWSELTQIFLAEGKSLGTATRSTNEARMFFEADGSTLWITFMDDRLQWGVVTDTPAEPHQDRDGVWRAINGGWSSDDLNGQPLSTDRLAGSLTKLVGYQGTSCRVDVADYVKRRINGQALPAVQNAENALAQLQGSIVPLMQLLEPKDFELLVDLIFSTSGWRRISPVGKTQKTIDFAIELPSTDERAFVQVKSKTTQAELESYLTQFIAMDDYDKMFFAFHTQVGDIRCDDERVSLLGPDKLAKLVVKVGLTTWIIRKVA